MGLKVGGASDQQTAGQWREECWERDKDDVMRGVCFTDWLEYGALFIVRNSPNDP